MSPRMGLPYARNMSIAKWNNLININKIQVVGADRDTKHHQASTTARLLPCLFLFSRFLNVRLVGVRAPLWLWSRTHNRRYLVFAASSLQQRGGRGNLENDTFHDVTLAIVLDDLHKTFPWAVANASLSTNICSHLMRQGKLFFLFFSYHYCLVVVANRRCRRLTNWISKVYHLEVEGARTVLRFNLFLLKIFLQIAAPCWVSHPASHPTHLARDGVVRHWFGAAFVRIVGDGKLAGCHRYVRSIQCRWKIEIPLGLAHRRVFDIFALAT